MSKFVVVANAVNNKDFLMLGDWVLIGDNGAEIINIKHSYDVEQLKSKHKLSDDEWEELINTSDSKKTQFKIPIATCFVTDVLSKMEIPSQDIPTIVDIGIPELALAYAVHKEVGDERLKNLILQSKSPNLVLEYISDACPEPDEDIKMFALESGDMDLMVEYCAIDNNDEMRDKIIKEGGLFYILQYLIKTGKDEKARKALINEALIPENKVSGALSSYLERVDEDDQEIIDIIVNSALVEAAALWVLTNSHRKGDEIYNLMADVLVNNTNTPRVDNIALLTTRNWCKDKYNKIIERIWSSNEPKRIISAIEGEDLELDNQKKKELQKLIIEQNDSDSAYEYCAYISDLVSMRKVILNNKDACAASMYYRWIKQTDEMLDLVIDSKNTYHIRSITFYASQIKEHKEKAKQAYKQLIQEGKEPEKVTYLLDDYPEERDFVKQAILKSKNPKSSAIYFTLFEKDPAIKQIIADSNNVEAALICANIIRYDKELEQIVMTHGDYNQQSEYREKTLLR